MLYFLQSDANKTQSLTSVSNKMRPFEIGAKFSQTNITPDEFVQPSLVALLDHDYCFQV
jgi:hypothetical protein